MPNEKFQQFPSFIQILWAILVILLYSQNSFDKFGSFLIDTDEGWCKKLEKRRFNKKNQKMKEFEI